MPDHYLKVEGARTLNTLWFARVQEAFADAVDQRAIALIHGVAGVGKTYAVKYAIETCTLPVYRFVFPPDVKMRQISDVLLRRITGVRHQEERFLLADTLREVLSEEPLVIVIDEMQLLSLESIEYLRWLWDSDDPDTQFSLILVGGNDCWNRVRRHPHLRSRIYVRAFLKPLTREDVCEAIPRYHPIYEQAQEGTIRYVDSHFARGNLREWASFTNKSQLICERDGKDTLTQKIAKEAIELLGREAHGI